MLKIDVLGTDYEIIEKKYDDDDEFKRKNIDGYCDDVLKEIVIMDLATAPALSDQPKKYLIRCEKQVVRHEIIHAFLSESGLQDSASCFGGAWAKNEEMVDWMALQFPKIMKAFVEVGCSE